MATKCGALAVKVGVKALIEKYRERLAEMQGRQEELLDTARHAKLEKISALQVEARRLSDTSTLEFAKSDYRFQSIIGMTASLERAIAMLEMSTEEVISVSADSDLGRLL